MSERCLVTGSVGFIGSHVSRYLLSQGHQVRVIDILSTGDVEKLSAIRSDIEFLEED